MRKRGAFSGSQQCLYLFMFSGVVAPPKDEYLSKTPCYHLESLAQWERGPKSWSAQPRPCTIYVSPGPQISFRSTMSTGCPCHPSEPKRHQGLSHLQSEEVKSLQPEPSQKGFLKCAGINKWGAWSGTGSQVQKHTWETPMNPRTLRAVDQPDLKLGA